MAGQQLIREFESVDELEQELDDHFLNGGCFVDGCSELMDGEHCELILVAPGGGQIEVPSTVVWVVGGERPGVGVEFQDFDRELLDELADFVRAAERHSDPSMSLPPAQSAAAKPERADETGTPTEGVRSTESVAAAPAPAPAPAGQPSAHERLRGLTVAQQVKVAREGDVNERTILERIYGKGVWDALLSNPRLTHAEVSRLARMGQLPTPQLEQIASSAQWLASAQVRRALLANRRLPKSLIEKVLRSIPKHELKLVPKQTAYPPQVRDAARKLLPQ